MCGICGIVDFAGIPPTATSLVQQMCDKLIHRGPDEDGFYHDSHSALGMRRLSIIDLETGRQPISNEDGSIQLIFNGEIYNYRTLRQKLEKQGHRFKTQSDSEVIVHAYESYGTECLEHFNGQFAFAIWDKARRSLFLARDRLGIKPLYYFRHGNLLVFASELSALLLYPETPREINPAALGQLLSLEYIPSPNTILKDIQKLPPGHLLCFQPGSFETKRYWEIKLQPSSLDFTLAKERLRALIDDAVKLRLISDVPLGVYLSGGIDSSAIAASMNELGVKPIRSFSIGFAESSYNELPFARQVSAHFGTRHVERKLLQSDIIDLVEKLLCHLDEPLADFSIFPTYLVSKLAGQSVKVALSGDGGDEIFGGYDPYFAQQYAAYYDKLPAILRHQLLPSLAHKLPPQPAKKGLINKFKRFVEGGMLPANLKHARWMLFLSSKEKSTLFSSDFLAISEQNSAETYLAELFAASPFENILASMQYVDVKSYLANNILTKVDRMSMAVSIETRTPLLDHRIVEFALNLPPQYKMKRNAGKLILKEAMGERLPAAILNRNKQGFSIPLKHWLRGALRPLMVDTLTSRAIRESGFFQPATIELWMSEHLAGKINHSHRLWALMVFAIWQERVRQLDAATPLR